MVIDLKSPLTTHYACPVWLNGVEISLHCFYADDEAGIVRVYKVNRHGHKYVVGSPTDPNGAAPEWPHIVDRPSCDGYGEIATEELHGVVRIGRPDWRAA